MTDAAITLDVNLDDLTLGEIEALEDYTGSPIGDIFEAVAGSQRISAKVLTAFVWLVQHRTNPAYTFEDARNVKASLIQGKAETDPTEPSPSSENATATANGTTS